MMTNRSSWLAAAACAALLALAAPAGAQETALPQNVISANPFGLLLEFMNGEYERVVSNTATAGVGGSFITLDNDDFVNVDAFYRLYPQGSPLDGWAFGVKVGATRVEDGTYGGFGFDVNRSWILGAEDNFYVGVGFGLKRLLAGDDETFDTRFIPTIRVVNVGYAF